MAVVSADRVLEMLDAMDVLFSEAKSLEDRRADLRIPFFRPVSIMLPGDEMQRVSAFSRDLSIMGIGLCHREPLEPGDVVLTVPTEHGELLHFDARITWCHPCGEDWYVSGGRLLGLTASVEEEEKAI